MQTSIEDKARTIALPSPAAVPRITTSEICSIARLSPQTIGRRVKDGKLPKAVDRGEELLFDRLAVYQALGIPVEGRKDDARESHSEEDPWVKGAHALGDGRTPAVHRPQKTRRRRRVLFPASC